MQKFNTSLDQPWALVRFGAQTPGKRVGTSMAWLEYRNEDGTYIGGEVWMHAHSGIGVRSGLHRNSRWSFTYKRQKVFAPEDVLYRFPHGNGSRLFNDDNTKRVGGPLLVEIRRAKELLPIVPGFDEVERPAREMEL
jgi:hypothetical protein